MASRESCLVALKQVLDVVEGIKLVSREFTGIDEVAQGQFPCILINDDGKEALNYKSGDFADIEFTVSIIGYVNFIQTSTALNELDVLTKEALGSDFLDSSGIMRTAGVAGFRIDPLTERSGFEFSPLGWFEREITLMYEGRLSTGL